MRRLAFVLPSLAGGGAERVLLLLAGALDSTRFAPNIVLLDAAGPLASALPADVPVHSLERRRVRRALPRLRQWLCAGRFDAVVSSLGYVNLALLALRPFLPQHMRIVVREANTPSLSLRHGPAPAATSIGYRLLYPTADAVLCQHRRTAAEMVDRFAVAPERVHDLPNPVDVDVIRATARIPRRVPGPGRRFVAAGRMTAQKGFDRLIPLFAETDEADQLTILGDGPDRETLQRLATHHGVGGRVRLAGYEDQPWPRYAGADAVLVPSRWEGMPNVALEALACGTPVIATPESGGIGELADEAHPAAVTVAPWGAAFADALRAVKPAAVDGPRPSALPSRYRLDAVVERLVAVLESC
jgi:glycosyltransferase involved in cell wall biosynthesis